MLSSDVFYNAMGNVNDLWRGMGVLAVEDGRRRST